MSRVPLRDYVDETARLRDRANLIGAVGIVFVSAAIFWGIVRATSVAFDAAEAKGVQHNGLIEYLRQLMGKFLTRESLIAFIAALGVFATIYVAFLKP